MKYVPASELAERITAIMSTVEAGEEVTVTGEGGKAVARIVPVAPELSAEDRERRKQDYFDTLLQRPCTNIPVTWTRDDLYERDRD